MHDALNALDSLDARLKPARALKDRLTALSGSTSPSPFESLQLQRAAFLSLWCEARECEALQTGTLNDPAVYVEAVKTLNVLLEHLALIEAIKGA